ncbi:MAG: ribosome recycling factor [Vampirovibrionales bacterium]|nr:ribosome recycling factor [Vampirovibrionales bacterium]
MVATVDELFSQAESKMKKAIGAVQNELGTVRTGRANPLILDRVLVDYYGTPTPIRQMANVSVQGGQTLVIQPYDKSGLAEIEKAIAKSELGLPANNDGAVIRINIPPLTEDRRKDLAKSVRKMGEDGKIAVRNVRRDASNDLDRLNKELNLPEDEFKTRQDRLQKLTDRYNAQIDTLIAEKEKEVLEI